jgi:hypothetical protein
MEGEGHGTCIDLFQSTIQRNVLVYLKVMYPSYLCTLVTQLADTHRSRNMKTTELRGNIINHVSHRQHNLSLLRHRQQNPVLPRPFLPHLR